MRHFIHIALALMALTLLPAWSWDHEPRPYGDAYRMQFRAQMVNPDPAPDTPVTGLNGQVAADAMQGYRAPAPEDQGPSFTEVLESLMDSGK